MVGWKDFFRKRVQVSVIAGGHVLTDNEAGKGLVSKVAVMKGDRPGYVYMNTLFGQKEFKFEKITWQRDRTRSIGKTAAGALVGTVIAGGIGTVAGAAIGARRRDISTAFLYISDDSGEHEVHIECSKQQYAEISQIAHT